MYDSLSITNKCGRNKIKIQRIRLCIKAPADIFLLGFFGDIIMLLLEDSEGLIMDKMTRYKLKRGTKLTEEQKAMIEAAKNLEEREDEDLPVVDPVSTPEHYAALMQAVAERNQRIAQLAKKRA